MPFLRKYNTLTVTGTTAIRIPIIKRGVVDFAVGADWTPAAGDVKIAIDGAAAANVTNLPTAVAMGNTAYWEFILTAAELTCKACVVTVADSATKAVEDQAFIVETFGHASAMYQADLSAANLPANATQFAGQAITAAAGVTLPSSVASPTNITAATGIVLSGVTHTGAVIPTVSALTGLTASDVAAIKAKTDNLPNDPADHSIVIAATDAILTAVGDVPTNAELATALGTADDATLAAIAAEAVKTTAIKAKTDQLSFTTANRVDSTAVLDSDARVTLAASQPAITFGAVTIDVSGSTPNITLTGSGSGNGIEWTRSGSGDPLDADVVDQIQSGLSTLDASGVRSAVGLASANLDTQLGDIPTSAEFEARSIVAANYATSSALSTVEGKIDTIDNFIDTEVLAIKAVTDKIDTGLVLDGAVYQFTANMLELGPSGGGGSSVNVLPATGIVADRSAGVTLTPVVGETISQSITMYRTDGTTAVNVSGKTLAIVFETLSGVDVATVASGSITISGASSNIVTFAYPSAVTASERTLRFAIRDAAAPLTMYLQGVCSVVAAPKVDA